jgi:hypothetical protein
MELRSNIRNAWAILATVVVIVLLLSKSCSPSGLFGGETILTRDTITIIETVTERVADEHYRDSIRTWYHKNPTLVPEYVFLTKEELPKGIDLSDTSEFFKNTSDTSKLYTYGANDSLLHYRIYVRSMLKPSSVWMEYDVATDRITDSTYIKDSTTTTVTNNIKEKVRVNQVYFGGSAVVYPSFKAVFAEVDFVSNRGWQAEAGVGFMDNAPAIKVGLKKLITFIKK